jgi:hypothetical protein
MGWYGAAVPDRRFRSAGRRFSCGVTPRRLSVLSIGSLAFGVPASQQAVYSRVAAADTGHRPPVPGRRRDTDPQAQMLAREVRPGPQPDLRQQGQQRRASPVPAGQPRHLISEGDSHAARVPAQEPAHRQADQRRPAVLHRAQVLTAHPRKTRITGRTLRTGRHGRRLDHHLRAYAPTNEGVQTTAPPATASSRMRSVRVSSPSWSGSAIASFAMTGARLRTTPASQA